MSGVYDVYGGKRPACFLLLYRLQKVAYLPAFTADPSKIVQWAEKSHEERGEVGAARPGQGEFRSSQDRRGLEASTLGRPCIPGPRQGGSRNRKVKYRARKQKRKTVTNKKRRRIVVL